MRLTVTAYGLLAFCTVYLTLYAFISTVCIMDLVQRALQAVQQCEREIRRLAQDALASNNYTELKSLADLAERLRRLRDDEPLDAEVHVQAAKALEFERKAPDVRRVSRGRSAYPLFFRDEDRLVKVAWSKKERAEYEHRTSREVVDSLYEAIRTKYGVGRLFGVAALLPFSVNEGESVPDYQLYLAIKWFHNSGILQKLGREGYRLTGHNAGTAVDLAWQALPELSKL